MDMAYQSLGNKVKRIPLRPVFAKSPFSCMQKISASQADVASFDGGQVYTAGSKYRMKVLLAEQYNANLTSEAKYLSVAIVHASDKSIHSLKDLEGKKSCHTGVGRTAGWNIPIGALISRDVMKVKNCNNPVISASQFFKESCAPFALDKSHNIDGTNPENMCKLCGGVGKNFCNAGDTYLGYDGAFKCLRDGGGDVAFAKGITAIGMTKGHTQPGYRDTDFELLCLDGRRVSIYDSDTCYWGKAPSHAVMVSQDMTSEDKSSLKQYLLNGQKFLGRYSKIFKMFGNSTKLYGKSDLMFKDSTLALVDSGKENYNDYLGSYLSVILGLNKCDPSQVNWCVLPNQLVACDAFTEALQSNKIFPTVNCVAGSNSKSCMEMVNSGKATFTLASEAHLYLYPEAKTLRPYFKEDLGMSRYIVAVIKVSNKASNLKKIMGQKVCFDQIDDIPWPSLLSTLGILSTKVNTGNLVSQMGIISDKYLNKGACLPNLNNNLAANRVVENIRFPN
ncbi:unnamed protein product [Gordionus sp. m RMFG-2023]